MAIKGVSKDPIPYVPEVERDNIENPTCFWIKPKTGKDANESMRRYAAASKEGRKGYRDLDVRKLNSADIEEFINYVIKVENYEFSDNYPELEERGVIPEITDEATLIKICHDLPADILIEIFDAAANVSQLKAGAKKNFKSSPTSVSGSKKVEKG